MRTILRMIRKDLLRKVRSPLGIGVMLLFPVIFAAILALAFGGNDVPRVHLLVENRDDSLLGSALMSALGSDQIAEHFDVEVVGEEGIERLRKGQGSALLRIPEGFTRDFLDGEQMALELYRNPAQGIMPEIAEQVAGVLAEVLSAGSRVLRGPLDTIGPYTRSSDLEMSDQTVAEAAIGFKGIFDGADRFLAPLVIDFESVVLDEEGEEAVADDSQDDAVGSSSQAFSIFLFVFPGVSVWSLFMIGDACMRDILTESEAGTLRRQLHAPIGTGTVILAKAGFTAVVSLVALAILTATGWWAADRPVDPIGYVTLSLALILAITGAGATVYGAAGTQNRGATISSVVYLALGFAGGSFLPLSSMPAAVQALAPVSPFYWGTQGYQKLLSFDGNLLDVLSSVAVLSGLGIVLLTLGAALLRRQLARGGA